MAKAIPTRLRSDRTDDYFNFMLKNARKDLGYSLKDLAEKAQVSFAALSGYERLRFYPTPDSALSISQALGKSVDEIFPKWLREYTFEVERERKYHGACDNPDDALFHAVPFSRNLANSTVLSSDYAEPKITRHDILRERVKGSLNSLNDREREVLMLRYGLGDGIAYSRTEIAKVFRLTRESIRIIQRGAIRKLQQFPRCMDLVDLI